MEGELYFLNSMKEGTRLTVYKMENGMNKV
jgi:hypothetical protein